MVVTERIRLGQTSIVVFLSKIVASALGFGATVYVARLLGADTLGIYSLALTVVSWVGVFGTMGITGGIRKRISEQKEPAAYAVAGVLIIIALFIVATIGIFLLREQINNYIGYPAAGYVILMLGTTLIANVISAILNGQHLVHIVGVLSPVHTSSRAGTQIAAIAVGLGLAGMLGGYVIGYLVFIIIGGFVAIRNLPVLRLPQRRHIRRILSFAKYAWLGGLKGKTFNWVDIALLGAFVSTSFVGYYTAAWNIAQFLAIFSAAVSQTMFPKMSETAADGNPEAVASLLNDALSYAGLILIPGLVGGTLLAPRILRIYSPEFTQAGIVMSVLIIATLLQSYQKQFTTTINALDRPDIAFRVNAVFIGTNVTLNIILISIHGWTGAAVATAASVGISLIIAYQYVSSLITFSMPTAEIGRQWLAAIGMGTAVSGVQQYEIIANINHNFSIVIILMLIGAGIYFIFLFILSSKFRTTAYDNIPNWGRSG